MSWSLQQRKTIKDLRIVTPFTLLVSSTLQLRVPVLMISDTQGHTPLQVESQRGCEHEVRVAWLPSLWPCKREPMSVLMFMLMMAVHVH